MVAKRSLSPDTHPSAEAVQLDLMRRAGPTRRAALAIRLSSSMIRASRRAVARRHPELDERGVMLRWVELHYGRPIAEALRRHRRPRE
jgi:hypothetical protein